MLKAHILETAVSLARYVGIKGLTRDQVARDAGVASGSVNYHFKDMDGLRDAVVEDALENEIMCILVEARLRKHPRVMRISAALKERIAAYIAAH